MAEKKKLAVVVDAGSAGQGNATSFDFSNFQESLCRSGTEGDAAGGAAVTRAQDDDSATYTTAYQARKTSIAEGLTSEQLVVEHRKSIANATGVDSTQLSGLTLSRRQSMSHEEYNEDVNQKAYESLSPYQFKDGEEEEKK